MDNALQTTWETYVVSWKATTAAEKQACSPSVSWATSSSAWRSGR